MWVREFFATRPPAAHRREPGGCRKRGVGLDLTPPYDQPGRPGRNGVAIGTVCSLAARLCAEAKDGQILVSGRIAEAVEAVARLEDLGNLELKRLRRPIAALQCDRPD